MPVGMMLDGMDPGELQEWQAYFRAKDIAETSKDVRAMDVKSTSGEDALNFMTAKLSQYIKR